MEGKVTLKHVITAPKPVLAAKGSISTKAIFFFSFFFLFFSPTPKTAGKESR